MAEQPKDILELDSGYKWPVSTPGPTVVTYSFLDDLPTDIYGTPSQGDEFWGYRDFSQSEQLAVKSLFDYLETIINVDFQDKTGIETGKITFGWVDGPQPQPGHPPSAAGGFIPDGHSTDGDVFAYNGRIIPGFFAEIMLHEICHAIGLEHPFADPGEVGPVFTDFQDSDQFTVMSYKPHRNGYNDVPITLGLYDISVLQVMYGSNAKTGADDPSTPENEGNNIYGRGEIAGWTNDPVPYLCIWDAGRNDLDTLSAAGMSAPSTIDLREGRFSSITDRPTQFSWEDSKSADNISIAFGAEIEKALGSSNNDLIIGNHLNNILDQKNGVRVDFFSVSDAAPIATAARRETTVS